MLRFRFIVKKGPAPGASFDVNKTQMVIGRDPSCDIPIADAEVSRRHARLMVDGDRCVIEDLGSTNGTFVNGRRISAPYELKQDDVVDMGENVTLVFHAEGFDPDATVMAGMKKVAAEMPPQAAFAGQVPQSPPAAAAMPEASAPDAFSAPAATPPVMPPKKKKAMPWLLAGGSLAMLICLCAAFLVWVDMTYRWCVFFPFLAGCH